MGMATVKAFKKAASLFQDYMKDYCKIKHPTMVWLCVSSPDLYVEILTYKVQVLKVGAVGSAQIMRVGFVPYDRRGPCSPTTRGHSRLPAWGLGLGLSASRTGSSKSLPAVSQPQSGVLSWQPSGLRHSYKGWPCSEISAGCTNSRIRKYIKIQQEKWKYLWVQRLVRGGLSLPACLCVVPERSRTRPTIPSWGSRRAPDKVM